MYVADKMRRTGGESKVVKFPQSSDISAPYILACNYADANPKLLMMALSGIQMLVNYEVVPPGDVKNILRVLSIQAATGKSELQLKLLQILLQLANSLSQNATTSQYLTEATISSFLTLALQLCDGRSSVSVSSTAFATVRQIIAIVMEGTCGAFRNVEADDSSSNPATSVTSPEKVSENFANSAQNLIKEMSLFIVSKQGEWMRGFVVPPTMALDILDDILNGWKDLMRTSPPFRALLKHSIYPALKPLLKSLQDDFANAVLKTGIVAASNFTSRVVRLARCFLLNFALPEFMDELNVVITLMIHSLQPDRSLVLTDQSILSFGDEPSSLIGSAGSLISRLNIPGLTKAANTGSSSRMSGQGVGLHGCHLSLAKSHNHSASPTSHQSQVLAHPAGACLEALLSFFSSDLAAIMGQETGPQLVTSAITNTVLSISAVICGGLAVESNIKEFDAAVIGSQLLALLEVLFSGSETSSEQVCRSVHDYLLSAAIITPLDLLILSFELMQVIMRLLVKLLLTVMPREGENFVGLLCSSTNDNCVSLFITKETLSCFQVNRSISQLSHMRQMTLSAVTSIYDSIQESCTILLLHVENTIIVRRTLGIMSELVMVAGVFCLQHPCDSIISALCRFTVPAWHNQDVQAVQAVPEQSILEVKPFSWRHMQAMVRLFQLVHILADVISDWDVIIDAIEQLIQYISSLKPLGDEIASSDIDKIFATIDKFKQYTVYLSDDSLMRLMTSLVAMSLNNLTSVGSRPRSAAAGDKARGRMPERKGRPPVLAYLLEGITSGAVSFSLQAAIEVTKYNSFRVSCVWQMVTSHLRMLATMKNNSIRIFAVAATHDMILTSLEYMQSSSNFPVALFAEDDGSSSTAASSVASISDDLIFNRLLPTYDACLMGGLAHKKLLTDRMKLNPMMPQLSQSDLLSSLTFLASARHEDVQINIIHGLLSMLQGGGEVVKGGGWNAIIVLVGAVPESMKAEHDEESNSANGGDSDDNKRWPTASLLIAFNCIKLVVDEFMDLVPVDAIVLVLSCLASFSSQDQDVNISLTSLEMLWKVYDQMMRNPKRDIAAAQAVFDVTMSSLLVSSMDHRPEIRHCSMNTLFAALTMTANASLTSGSQWKQVFDDVIFPLFQRAGDRSKHAAETNEEAIAPELKKGKKMTLHHSRDTAHKQWSETRVLALKGLARVIKTCTWLLLHEDWFRSTWAYALEVCSAASQAATVDQEVALAGLDVMFTMLKVISSNAYKSHHRSAKDGKADIEAEAVLEVSRESLWQLTWTAVNESAKFECQSLELALHICQNLTTLYAGGLDAEFKYSDNVRILCESIAMIARPRLGSQETSQAEAGNARVNKLAEVQLQRAVLELLKAVRPVDIVSLRSLISAYAEIAFASQYVQMTSPFSGRSVVLDMCPSKLRADVAEYFIGTILKEQQESSDDISYTGLRGAHAVILEMVFRRFVNDLCDPAISLRNETVDFVLETPEAVDTPREEEGKDQVTVGFFSSLGKMLTQPGQEQTASGKRGRKESLSGTLHSLPIYIPSEKEDVNTWTTFYPMSTELSILVASLETCSIHMSSNGNDDIPEPLRQKIFSALLCVMSPWRVHELPTATKSHGSVITSDEKLTAKLIRLIDLIIARGSLFAG